MYAMYAMYDTGTGGKVKPPRPLQPSGSEEEPRRCILKRIVSRHDLTDMYPINTSDMICRICIYVSVYNIHKGFARS